MEGTQSLVVDGSPLAEESEQESAGGPGGPGLSPSQQEVLERCLHTLTHARNDSHTLAALLLVGNHILCHSRMPAFTLIRRLIQMNPI